MAEEKKRKKRGLTVAKADKEEFERVWDFVHVMERLFDDRGFLSHDEWWNWDDEEEDKQELRKIQQELGCDEEDEEILLEFIKRRWSSANYSGSFGRILFDCETLIDNCCDPELDYLEFKPSIMYAERNALEKVEKIITSGEGDGLTAERILDRIKEMIEESKKEDEEDSV
jgi:hypothetical protein